MEAAVAILVQIVNWPLAGLVAWRTATRRVPPVAGVAVTVILASVAIAAWDPSSQAPFSRAAIAVVNICLAALLAVFPDGRAVPRWIAIPAVIEIALQAGNLASGFSWETSAWWPAHFAVTWSLLLFGGQLYRYVRRSSHDERERTRWPLLALVAMILGFLLWTVAVAAAGAAYDFVWLANLLLALPAPAFAVGLIAPRLLPVDPILRAVVWLGVWSLAVSLVAWGSIEIWGRWAPDAAAWMGAMTTAVAAVALWMAARLVADRLVRGRRELPIATLATLGDRLGDAIDPREVPDVIVQSVTDGLGLRGARLEGRSALAAASGTVSPGMSAFPIVHARQELAVLEVSPRPGESELSADDRVQIQRICTQAGIALHGALVVAELIDARSRLVYAREEERKRLRRDLHDDVAATLAGLRLGAAAVEAYARADDPRAADAAHRLASDLGAATRQLREIAYDLRPPVLDDRGLLAAIRDRVGSTEGSVPLIVVNGPAERLDLPAAVETAALRIVQEAVANVRRHAAASRGTVTVSETAESLVVSIEDDGVGIRDGHAIGMGLASMSQRAEEVGGSLIIERRNAGGTVVEATLPVGAAGTAKRQAEEIAT